MMYRSFYVFYHFCSAFRIHRVFPKKISYPLNIPVIKLESNSLFASILAANVVKCVSQPEETQPKEPSSIYVKSRLENCCLHSINEIINLVEEISAAVTNCSIQYKDSLNELITTLKTYKSLEVYSVLREELEHAIIVVRANVTDNKKEFLDLITIYESVYKVATAVSELSFVIGSESPALKLFEAVNTLQMQVNEEIEDIKKLEKECLSVEKNFIEVSKEEDH